MTERELKKKLESAGWVITHGTGHDMAKHPDQPGTKIPIPRHTGDIPIGTAKSILKAAGIK